MKVIQRPRQAGKTTDLIQECAALNAANPGGVYYIVVVNDARARNVAALARSLGIDIPFPVTLDEATQTPGRYIRGYLVDDLGQALWLLFGRKVVAVTVDEEPFPSSRVQPQ